MNNAEYYGFNSNNGYFNFTKHIDRIPKKVKDMNTLEFLKWLSSEKAPELTASEKKFLADIVNAYAGLVDIQTVEKIYDVREDFYYLKFKTDVFDSSNTFSCFNGMFAELEEHKDYNIRKLLGKDC